MLDLPGIIEGASEGRGRGRQVIAVAKACDLVLMVLEADKAEDQRRKLTIELDKMGIRLNRKKPDVTITPNKSGMYLLIIITLGFVLHQQSNWRK